MVAETGEPALVLSQALLESAWAKPINRWHYESDVDLLSLAVSLMVGIAQNHPFQQGNKRTAFAAGQIFLGLNGYRIDPSLDSIQFADKFVLVIEHKVEPSALIADLREWVFPR